MPTKKKKRIFAEGVGTGIGAEERRGGARDIHRLDARRLCGAAETENFNRRHVEHEQVMRAGVRVSNQAGKFVGAVVTLGY
jgi:hypothetical protein